jgi:hypothetical protein
LDYRFSTSDHQYDDMIMQAMTFQVGEEKDYMPRNWSASMGNDDQAFWALAALVAAETGFTNPPEDTKLDWLALAQAVFNEQTRDDRRTQTGDCKGLLRWQAFQYNNGWDYINTIANTCYFNIGSRLARYFNNDTLADMVEKTYDMLRDQVHYIDDAGNVYDGGHEGNDCKDINKSQFSYNAALLIQGIAHMYNMVRLPRFQLLFSCCESLLMHVNVNADRRRRQVEEQARPPPSPYDRVLLSQRHGIRVVVRAWRHLHRRYVVIQGLSPPLAGLDGETSALHRSHHHARAKDIGPGCRQPMHRR